MLYRPGARVGGAACFAASTAEQSVLEPDFVGGLSCTMAEMLQSGELQASHPHLGDLAQRTSYLNKCAGLRSACRRLPSIMMGWQTHVAHGLPACPCLMPAGRWVMNGATRTPRRRAPTAPSPTTGCCCR